MPGRRRHHFSLADLAILATAVSQGWSKRRIADYLGVSEITVRRFLLRNPEVADPDDFEIVMPQHLTRKSPPTPIREGDAAYCVVSDRTGLDNHWRLQRPRGKAAPKSAAKFKPKGAR